MVTTPTQAVEKMIFFFNSNGLKIPFESSFWEHDLVHAIGKYSTRLKDEIKVEVTLTLLEGKEPVYEVHYSSYKRALALYKRTKFELNESTFKEIVEECKSKIHLFKHIDDDWINEFLILYQEKLTPYEEYIE